VWTGTGVQNGSFNPAAAGVGAATITYSVTTFGCTTARSASIQVNACAERHLTLDKYPAVIVYPNPNDGSFNIRVNTDLYSNIGLKIYDSKGQELKAQQFSGVHYGSVLSSEIRKMPSGTYHLFIYSNDNGFSSKGISIMVTH